MTDSFKNDSSQIIREQLEKLDDFVTTLAPALGCSDTFAYLDRWEKTTRDRIAGIVSAKQLQGFRNVRLKQRFELPEDEQVVQLIAGFRELLRSWLA